MPFYEYQCQEPECQHIEEVLQSMSSDPLEECPKCKNDTLKKIVSTSGFRLSGSGWYETDFKSSNRKNISGK